MIHQILKDLLIKVTITAVIILAVIGFGTYKYIQFKEEEIKGKYVEELSAQRKAYDSQIEQINKVNTESLEKQKVLIEDYKKHLDSIQLDYEALGLDLCLAKRLAVAAFFLAAAAAFLSFASCFSCLAMSFSRSRSALRALAFALCAFQLVVPAFFAFADTAAIISLAIALLAGHCP